jgi:hypothetical protein
MLELQNVSKRFSDSYLPGKSRMHVAVYVGVVILLPLTILAVTFERDALQDPVRYAAILSVLGIAWIGVRVRTVWLGNASGAQPEFEDEPAGRLLTRELWDSRFTPNSVALTPAHPVLRTCRRRDA